MSNNIKWPTSTNARRELIFGLTTAPSPTQASLTITKEKIFFDLVTILHRYVLPALCLFGFFGNLLSFYVLLRNKLKKPSNIFLFALTVSDCLYLLYPLDVTKLLIFFGSGAASIGWVFPENVAYALFVINVISETFTNIGAYATTTFPVVITFERCLAVFLPLKFKRLVTPKKAWLVVFCVFLFWKPWCVSAAFHSRFYYAKLNGEVSIGLAIYSSYYLKNVYIITLFDKYIFSAMSSWIPVILVIIGSVLVGVKVKLAHGKRRELSTSSAADMSKSMKRTTRTLLSLALLFAVLYGYVFLVDAIRPDTFSDNDFPGTIIFETRKLATYTNSSCNFFVYLLMNKKFREIFLKSYKCPSRVRTQASGISA